MVIIPENNVKADPQVRYQREPNWGVGYSLPVTPMAMIKPITRVIFHIGGIHRLGLHRYQTAQIITEAAIMNTVHTPNIFLTPFNFQSTRLTKNYIIEIILSQEEF